jgi:large subunit ribosomal protein L4
MKLDVYKIDGNQSGDSIELSDEIFGIEPNDHVIYLAVKAYLANQRQGTHKTKERSENQGDSEKGNLGAVKGRGKG